MFKILEYLSNILYFVSIILPFFLVRRSNVFMKENKKIRIKSKKSNIFQLYGVILFLTIVNAAYQYFGSDAEGFNKRAPQVIGIFMPSIAILVLALKLWEYCKQKKSQMPNSSRIRHLVTWTKIAIDWIVFILFSSSIGFIVYGTYVYFNEKAAVEFEAKLITVYLLLVIIYVCLRKLFIEIYDEKHARKISITYREKDYQRKIYTEMKYFSMCDTYITYDSEDLAIKTIIPLDKVENIKIHYE